MSTQADVIASHLGSMLCALIAVASCDRLRKREVSDALCRVSSRLGERSDSLTPHPLRSIEVVCSGKTSK